MPLCQILRLTAFAAVLVLFPFAATALIRVGTFETLESASDVEVVGGLAYLAEDDGFRIIDVSNPAAPVQMSALLGGAVGVEVVVDRKKKLRFHQCPIIVPGILLSRTEAWRMTPALARESASDVVGDLSAIEDFERRMDRQLTADVNRTLDAIVADQTAQQVRWLAQHYFDAAAAGGRVVPGASPVALISPANSR